MNPLKLHAKKNSLTLLAAMLGALFVPALAFSQSAIIYGSVSNFDISNDTGRTCHGFELELDGLDPTNVTYTFSAQRYGNAQVLSTATGVKVRWESPYDPVTGRWAERTLPHTVAWFPG